MVYSGFSLQFIMVFVALPGYLLFTNEDNSITAAQTDRRLYFAELHTASLRSTLPS